MSRAPRDMDELLELAGDDPKEFADTLEADGRAEGDATKVEEARMVRRAAKAARAAARDKATTTGATANPTSKRTTNPTTNDKDGPKRKDATNTKATKKTNRRAPATRRAIAQATPDRQVASVVRSGSSYFWTIAGGIVLLVIVYQLTRNGERAAGAIRLVGTAVDRIIHPRGAFPVIGEDIQDPNEPYMGGPILPTPDKLRQP